VGFIGVVVVISVAVDAVLALLFFVAVDSSFARFKSTSRADGLGAEEDGSTTPAGLTNVPACVTSKSFVGDEERNSARRLPVAPGASRMASSAVFFSFLTGARAVFGLGDVSLSESIFWLEDDATGSSIIYLMVRFTQKKRTDAVTHWIRCRYFPSFLEFPSAFHSQIWVIVYKWHVRGLVSYGLSSIMLNSANSLQIL